MTYIPDARRPIDKIFNTTRRLKNPNYYYEGLLNEQSQRQLAAYDYGVIDTTNALDNYEDAFENAYDMVEPGDTCYLTDEEYEFLNQDHIVEFIRLALLRWAEMNRNEFALMLHESTYPNPEMARKIKEFEEDYKKLTLLEFLEKYPQYDNYIDEYFCNKEEERD